MLGTTKHHLQMVFSFLFLLSVSACGSGGVSLPTTNTALVSTANDLLSLKPTATLSARKTQYVAIDCGSERASGNWQADTDYSMVGHFGTQSVSQTIETSNISNPGPQQVYQNQRYATLLTYVIPHLAPSLSYDVRLTFVESFFRAAGRRVFDVKINGIDVLSNFDIFRSANGANIAIAREFKATPDASGTVVIKLDASTNNATIAAIEVISGVGAPTPTPSPSPLPYPSSPARPTPNPGYGPRISVGPQPSITCAPRSVNLSPGEDIETVVTGHSSGTPYCLAPGRYTAQAITPHDDDSFIGQKGAILDGDAKTVFAFKGNAKNVTVKNLVIQNYSDGSSQQNAALDPVGSSGWNILNNEVASNNGVGLVASANYNVIGNYLHNNGTSGYVLTGSGVTFTDNEVSFSNPNHSADPAYNDGGGKSYETVNAVISYNYVHDNYGPGIWEDVDSIGTTVRYNDLENNARSGIMHEISWNAVIRNNYLSGNGWSRALCGPKPAGTLFCPSIFISNSGGRHGSTVDVSYNTIATGGTYAGGIGLLGTNRGTSSLYPSYGPWLVQNVHVHNNTVNLASSAWSFGAVDRDGSDPAMFTNQGNSFDYDSFTGADSSAFFWGPGNINGVFTDFAGFQDKGQEVHGSSR
jgi:parallel beta-helix repeat protein